MKRVVFIGILVGMMAISVLAIAENEKLISGAIPLEMYYRVLPLQYVKGISGTCFVVDIDGRQYIITARHLVPNIKAGDFIQLHINQEWRKLKVNPIFPKNDKTDIAALATNQLIAPKMKIVIDPAGVILGQDVYFLGFPYGLGTPFKSSRNAYLPFVKKGILSAMDSRPESGKILYLDGHNNPGFSGGPVIFANFYKQQTLQVVGVVSAYRSQNIPVNEVEIEEPATQTGEKKRKTVRFVQENTGIVIAYGVEEIIAAIRANPIGFPLP